VWVEPENMHEEKANGVRLMAGKGSKRKRVSEDPAFVEGEPEHEVERIVDHHVVQNGVHCLVKCRGCPKESNTWEPEENLANCMQMLRNYHKKCKVLVSGSASIGSPTFKAVEKFKKGLGYPTKEVMENIMQTFSGRGGLVHKVPTENDIDNKILQLLELPKDRWDPMAVQNIKNDLVIREFHFKWQEQLKKLQVSEMLMNSSADKAHIKVENLVDLEEIPTNFTYVNDCLPAEGISIPVDPPVGCDCHPACSPDS
jgi:histone-lysine N-methyltransferase SUV39H